MKEMRAELWTNQFIEIECEDKSLFLSEVIKVEKDTVFIRYPFNLNHEPMELFRERPVTVYFYEDEDKYEFACTLEFLNQRVFFLSPLREDVRKVQRRKYFRVPANVPIWLDTESGERIYVFSDDVSGGGFSFIQEDTDPFPIHAPLKGGIQLGQKDDFLFVGRIVRKVKDADGKTKYGVVFDRIADIHRSAIVSFCYKRQIELKKMLKDI